MFSGDRRNVGSKILNYLFAFLYKYLAHYSGLPKSCWQGISVNIIESSLGGICFFLSLYFVNTLHLSVVTAGIILSSYGLGRMLGGFLGGNLSDKISPLRVSMFSLIMQATGFLLLIKLHTVNLLIIDLFFIGVATYAFITSNNLWILNQCKNQEDIKLKTLSMIHAGSNLGLGISALIVSLLSHFGFSSIFLFSGVMLALCATYLSFIEKNTTHFSKPTDNAQKNKTPSPQEAKNIPIVIFILTCLFFVGLIIAQIGATYPLYINAKFPTMGIHAVSFLFALNSILIVIFQTPVVNFFNKHNKIFMVGIGAFLMGFGMFILNFSFSFIIAVMAHVLYTVGEMLFFSIAQMVCYQRSPENKRGLFLGLFRTTFAMSVFVGPTVGGFIYNQYSGETLWLLCGIIGIASLTACSFMKKYD